MVLMRRGELEYWVALHLGAAVEGEFTSEADRDDVDRGASWEDPSGTYVVVRQYVLVQSLQRLSIESWEQEVCIFYRMSSPDSRSSHHSPPD